MEAQDTTKLAELTVEIVSAYVSNNSVETGQLASLISDVHAALKHAPNERKSTPDPQLPAVPIKKSVTPDYIISLEDGQKFRSLKRHLKTAHGMTPDEYRSKWGLPRDYPMVAPNYAKQRSDLAKSLGLGRKPLNAAATPAEVQSNPALRRPRRTKVAA